jgi:predicted PurR-regulated permease PerM
MDGLYLVWLSETVPRTTMDKRWSPTTKRLIIAGIVILFVMLITRISGILPQVAITIILAYVISPIADLISKHLRLNRTFVVAIIYLVLIALILTLPALLIPFLVSQIQDFVEYTPELVREIGELFKKPLIFGDLQFEAQDLYNQISSSIQAIISSMASSTIGLLTNIASGLFWTVFILVASFYLVKDVKIIVTWADEVVPPGYRHDFRRIRLRIANAWNAFLRGQLVLCIVMGVIVAITMAAIGLPNALFIGLLFGVLEFVPNLGPTIASVPAVLIAFFEGSTVLNISNGWFAILVIIINSLLQQLENNFLVPRILGQSLNLHPLVVLIAAIIGAQLAGVLGILLAAPAVATLRILSEYVYYRLLDIPPFPEDREATQLTTADADQQEGAPKDTALVSPAVAVQDNLEVE